MEGYCRNCRPEFSFLPRLAPGDRIADRYAIEGCLADGGLGWVYLARDTNLDDSLVVLKGVINSTDPTRVAAAVRERRNLRGLDHPGIVRIFDAVTVPVPGSDKQAGYIVMAYVHGLSLRQVMDAEGGSRGDQLRVEHVVNCGLQILAALGYLHDLDLLYCDMKPENVMLTAEGDGRDDIRVRLVDLGAVRRVDDHTTPVTRTEGYSPGEQEKPSVRLDIYQVGVTLGLLAETAADRGSTDGAGSGPEPSGVTSFRLLVDWAQHADPERRFGSAAELAEQLQGVRRELAAQRTGEQQPAPSLLFAPTATLLDGGLGHPPDLDRWTRPYGGGEARGRSTDTGRPTPARVAVGLPTPHVDPGDPAAVLLAQTGAPDARQLVDKLSGHRVAVPGSPAIEWLACRAQIELGDLDEARACLSRAVGTGGEAPDGWRAAWHRGLIALAAGEAAAAQQEFTAVRAMLPGEPAPELALGCCAEQLGDHSLAERCYRAVWRRDRSEASAAFGCARVALARSDRVTAAEVLDEVPLVSRHVDAARVAAVRAWCARLPGGEGLPTPADVAEAQRRLPTLVYLDLDSRRRLTASLNEVVLDRVRARGEPDGSGAAVPAAVRRAREALEASFRELAQQARTAEDHGVLVDRANAVRPRTWW